MSIQSEKIQRDIDFSVAGKINEAEDEIGRDIQQMKENMEDGRIPVAGETCQHNIRNIRKRALSRYEDIKSWFNASILSMINQITRMDDLEALHTKTEEINAIEAVKEKTEEEIKRLETEVMPRAAFDKFRLYGEYPNVKKGMQGPEGQKETVELSDSAVATAAARTYREYKNRKYLILLAGIAATLVFAAMDYSIIFSVFQASNLSVRLSALIAGITAATLDAPPYILGVVMVRRGDRERFWQLQGNVSDSGAANEIAGYDRMKAVLLVAIAVLFTAYFVLRVLLFLGGGDFNAAFHSVLRGSFSFEGVTFNSSDMISTFVPLATSVAAFAVGWMLSTSYTEYVKTSIVVIEDELEHCVQRCRERIIDCEKKSGAARKELTELRQSIWTSYIGLGESLPNDDETFVARITDACTKLNFPLYKQIYQEASARIRSGAARMLGRINTELAPYAADQAAISAMEVSREENIVLDNIWVMEDGAEQSEATRKAIQEIDSYIKQFQRALKSEPGRTTERKGAESL